MEENDVEVFERIPWESLEKPSDRRWVIYLLAAVVALGAVGVSIGRGALAPASPSPSVPSASTPIATSVPPAVATTGAPAADEGPESPRTWTEADLMALPGGSLELGAATLAEWFILDFFTRDGSGGSRSFVEWVAATETEWVAAESLIVTLLVRRLAARPDAEYQRLPMESWRVTTALSDQGWSVVEGPVAGPVPDMTVAIPAASGDNDHTGVEWTDGAGLEWVVRAPSTGQP